MNNYIAEIKNTLEEINRVEEAKDQISELANRKNSSEQLNIIMHEDSLREL